MSDLPPNVPEEALPNQDFIETINRLEKKEPEKVVHSDDVIMVQTPSGPVPLPKQEKTTKDMIAQEAPYTPEPLILNYHWTGDCPKHKISVSTITFDLEGKTIAVAYCEACKTNKKSRVVPLLDEPDKKPFVYNFPSDSPFVKRRKPGRPKKEDE